MQTFIILKDKMCFLQHVMGAPSAVSAIITTYVHLIALFWSMRSDRIVGFLGLCRGAPLPWQRFGDLMWYKWSWAQHRNVIWCEGRETCWPLRQGREQKPELVLFQMDHMGDLSAAGGGNASISSLSMKCQAAPPAGWDSVSRHRLGFSHAL